MEKIILPDSDDKLLELCEIQTFRSSGSGGQHVNTTDSAVRLIYPPLHLVVMSQTERSQYLNKLNCLKKIRDLVKKLNYRPKKRVPTKMSRAQKEANFQKKSKHSEKKKWRRKVDF